MTIARYFWVEFIRNLKERLGAIKTEIDSIRSYMEYLELKREALLFYKEIKSLLDNIGKPYSELEGDDLVEAKVFPEIRYFLAGAQFYLDILQDTIEENINTNKYIHEYKDEYKETDRIIDRVFDLLNRLEILLAYIKYGLDQLTGGENLRQTIHYFYSFTYPSMDIPSNEKILKAVSSVVRNYAELIIGKKWLNEHKVQPIAIAGFSGYAIYPHLYIAVYPIADTFRARFWIALGHEVQHEKNHLCMLIWSFYKRRLYDKSTQYNSNENTPSIYARKVELLFKDQKTCVKCLEEWEHLQSMLQRCTKCQYPMETLDEIISDISNTLLSGPSDFLSLLSQELDIWVTNKYIFDEHPPIFARYEYCRRVCEKYLKLKSFFSEYNDIINELKEEFYSHFYYDVHKVYYDQFMDFMMDFLNDIVELTKCMITTYLHKGNKIFFQ